MSRNLIVLLGDSEAGQLVQGPDGVLTSTYSTSYQDQASALPLSLSMPLARRTDTGPIVRAYCQGPCRQPFCLATRRRRAIQPGRSAG